MGKWVLAAAYLVFYDGPNPSTSQLSAWFLLRSVYSQVSRVSGSLLHRRYAMLFEGRRRVHTINANSRKLGGKFAVII